MNRKTIFCGFRTEGFTLAEVLIVVVILGVLAAIALPRFFPQAEKSRTAEAIGILSAIRQGEESYILENGQYLDPSTQVDGWAQLGIDDPNPGRYFNYSVGVNNGANPKTFLATATRNSNLDPQSLYRTKTITLDQDGTYGGDHPFRPNN